MDTQWIHSGYAPFIYPQNSFPYKLIDSSTIYYCIHNYLFIYIYISIYYKYGFSRYFIIFPKSRSRTRGTTAAFGEVGDFAERIGGFHQWIPKNGWFITEKPISYGWMELDG